ncbi:Actin-binding cofilin tropomyosin type protein [Lasiodiplodia theobromae]|uniref:Actin-binding cofilin tropomyosin type protein n=1 Tax=Lasiodiplodia theobromae TaxID=45133 RepID=UPI0015C3DBFA|nr:Actin-binding cofilin tropomyosin type protein [Lasiodiplodia theobromae]KAF4544737.1 Actin-binding cofilin tropomyosin type protein [Lasiodiplodia theobromae]
MEVSQRNSAALQERSQKLAAALVKRFENIVALASIRATEDILTLTRQMQELWLFGNLHTLDANDKQNVERMEQDVKAIIAAIEGLAKETL